MATKTHMVAVACLTVAVALLSSVGGYAQSATEQKPSPDAQGVPSQENATAVTTADDGTVAAEKNPVYVPSLDGSGLISMSGIHDVRILAGGAVSGGYDSNPNNAAQSAGAAYYSMNPYVAMIAGQRKFQYVVQYHPTITRYSSYAGQTMHEASAKFTDNVSSRWAWGFGMDGSHGDSSARLLAPDHTTAIGGVAGSGPDSASYLPNAGLVTNLSGGFDFSYKSSPRNSVGIQLTDAYNSYPDLHESGSVAGATLNFNRDMRPSLGMLAYAQTSKYYGELQCTTVGGGMGLRWVPRENTVLAFKGGPQLNTASCHNQQGFAYSASFSTSVTGRASLYATANREPVTGFLGPGLWQNNISAGYQRQILRKNIVGIDIGYVQSSTLVKTGNYDGYYLDIAHSFKIQRQLSLSTGYRSYRSSIGAVDFNRNTLTVSLSFIPDSRTMPW